MSWRNIRQGLFGLALLAVASGAGATDALRTRNEGEVLLTRVYRIGGKAVTPGRYVFQHASQANEHFLIVRRTGPAAIGIARPLDSTVVMRVPCEIVAAAKSPAGMLVHTRRALNRDGWAIMRVDFHHEGVGHVIRSVAP